MPLPELAGILISLGLGAPVQSKERTEAPGGGPSSPGRMSGFQRPHLSRRLSAQVNTEGPLHPENFLDVCRTGSVRQNWSHGDLGLRRAWETMSGVPLAQVPSRPRGRPPLPRVLWTAPGLPLGACARRHRAASLICLFCFLLSQNILFRRCHFD